MEIRLANEADYNELALMKWEHGAEDDIDYDEHNLDGVNKDEFVDDFVAFLKSHKEYEIIVAEVNGIVVSAMFVYLISKLPKPNGNAKYIAYLTNVYTKKEYRNKGIGTQMMNYIKSYLIEKKCELLFAWQAKIQLLGISVTALTGIMKYLSVLYVRNNYEIRYN